MLDRLQPGRTGEIQLTDRHRRDCWVMNPSLRNRFVGTPLRLRQQDRINLEATLAFAAKHPALGAEFRTLLTDAARRLPAAVVTPNSPPQLTLFRTDLSVAPLFAGHPNIRHGCLLRMNVRQRHARSGECPSAGSSGTRWELADQMGSATAWPGAASEYSRRASGTQPAKGLSP